MRPGEARGPACRRVGSAGSYTYQYAPGGNGPVLIAENDIAIDSEIEMMDFGGPGAGLADAVFWKKRGLGQRPVGRVGVAVDALVSPHYQYTTAPAPHPFEGAVVAKNDYRATGATSGAILLATSPELGWGGLPIELTNNLVFESGGFLPGTGGPAEHVTVVAGLINPATGLPYVHDNRIVGESASELTDPGIGPILARLNLLRKMLERR